MEVVAGTALALGFPIFYHLYESYTSVHRGTLKWVDQSKGRPGKLNVGVPIHVLSSTQQIEETFCSLLLALGDKPCIVGLDAEWKPNQVKGEKVHPVAVVQIATTTNIYILQLLHLHDGIPASLKEFLTSTRIIKVGVGIVMDAKKIQRDYKIPLRGCVELVSLAYKQNLFNTEAGYGLKSLTNYFVKLRIPKNKQIQLSDWSVRKLSKKQVYYAAADAWTGLLIFEQLLILHIRKLNAKRQITEKISISFWWKDYITQTLAHEWCYDLLDLPSKHSRKRQQINTNKVAKEWKGKDDLSRRKTPLYDGCQMLAPDGTHISYCNKDKVQWYLDKGIAELVPGSDPAIIKLKFFPSGKTGSESFASEGQVVDHDAANRCVICGNQESYQKFYVVPRCYRQKFPTNEKFHCSHDIILLCPACHFNCSAKVEEFKQNVIAKRYKVPITGTCDAYIIDEEAAMVAASAKQLKRNKKKMNKEQIEERRKLLCDYLKCQELTADDIDEMCNLDFKTKHPDYLSHGEAVVAQLLANEETHELQQFVVMWRRYFEDEFEPKFLPGYWDPNHEWEEQHGDGTRKTPYF